MWFGTRGGVSRYDGKGFVNFTRIRPNSATDGLANNLVKAIHCDPDGVMWFGTDGGGVSCYDGAEWASLDIRDGLAGNTVSSICRDSDGSLWFATDGGVTHYRRSNVPPKVNIVSVTTDKTYLDISAIPASTPGTRVTIEYNAIDFVTVPEKRQYRCRIKEIDSDWRKATKATSFDYTFDNPGAYTFQVQAIDRDMNYSEPSTVSLIVQLDPLFVALQTEVNHLRSEVGRKYYFSNIIGRSASMKQVYALMERAIDSGLTVLISGETGTGKSDGFGVDLPIHAEQTGVLTQPLFEGAENKTSTSRRKFATTYDVVDLPIHSERTMYAPAGLANPAETGSLFTPNCTSTHARKILTRRTCGSLLVRPDNLNGQGNRPFYVRG